jgi:purine-binding chemotaxis protein CheW
MVDLAKIRKKAKKDKGSAQVDEPAASLRVDEPATSLRVDESTSRRESPPTVPPTTDHRQPTTEIDKLARFKAEAGKRRAVEVTQVEETKERLELLTFLISGEQYAVDIERIVEIVTPRPVTRIPNADRSVVGIISLRGTIVTLVDVRTRLGHPDVQATDDTRIVVMDQGSETVGFLVDRVLRVVKIAPTDVEPHPVVHATELEAAIRGVFRTSGALTILLDLDKLLDSRSM